MRADRKIGKVCSRHPELGGERRASNRTCPACEREYNQRHRVDNRETITERSRDRMAARRLVPGHKAAERERARERYAADQAAREAKVLRMREQRSTPEGRAQRAAYRATPEHRVRAAETIRRLRAANPEYAVRQAERDRLRRQNAPEKVNANTAQRRAAKRQATPVWGNPFFIREAYALAKLREKVCGGKWHVDHIVPLNSTLVCGLHVEYNLRVIPATHNIAKGNRHWPGMP